MDKENPQGWIECWFLVISTLLLLDMKWLHGPFWFIFCTGLGVSQAVLSVVIWIAWVPVFASASGVPSAGVHYFGFVILLIFKMIFGGVAGAIFAWFWGNEVPVARASWYVPLTLGSWLIGILVYSTCLVLGNHPLFSLFRLPGPAEIAVAILTFYTARTLVQENLWNTSRYVFKIALVCAGLSVFGVLIGLPPAQELDAIVKQIGPKLRLQEIPCRAGPELSANDGRCFTYLAGTGSRFTTYEVRQVLGPALDKKYKLEGQEWQKDQELRYYTDPEEHWKFIVLLGSYPSMLGEKATSETQNLGYLRLLFRRVEVLNPSLRFSGY